MVHNKHLDAAAAYERAAAALIPEKTGKFVDGLLHEAFPELTDVGAVDPATRALIELRVNTSVVTYFKEQQQPIVDRAREAGATWEHVAESAELAQPSSAHSNWGPGREGRTALQRQRAADRRKSGPKEPPPGVTAVEAAKLLGIDRRTVASRAEKGEIRSVTVKSASGNDKVRYILD